MGHQFGFYLLPGDIVALELQLRGVGKWCVLHAPSPSSKPSVVSVIGEELSGMRLHDFYLARLEDVQEVVSDYVAEQGYWWIDVLRSPVIQFRHGYYDGLELGPGRMYFTDAFYAHHELAARKQEKSDDFKRWARAIFAKAKRSLKRYNDMGYIGANAEAWMNAGGRLRTN